MRDRVALCAASILFAWLTPVMAQETKDAAPADQARAPAADSDVAVTVAAPDAEERIDVAAIPLPGLTFKPDPEAIKNFDKYFYFHRTNTDFKSALADLRDCDGLSRGLTRPMGNMPGPNTDGLLSGLLVAAIFGPAQVRATRRVNMRRCMFYKGYQRYGLPKEIWQQFNFEEGFSDLTEPKRQAFLKQQAKVASGPKPQTEVLGR